MLSKAANHLPTIGDTSQSPSSSTKSLFWTCLFTATLLVVCGRGVLEIAIGKTAAYAAQFLVISIFLALLFAGSAVHRTARHFSVLATLYGLTLVALLSWAASLILNDVENSWIYVAVMTFVSTLLATPAMFDFSRTSSIDFSFGIALTGTLLLAVACLQQFTGVAVLPGSDLGTFGSTVRPASTTGSFLHYPIILALFAFAMIHFAKVRKSGIFLLLGIAFAGGAIASYSRSGIVILVVGFIFSVCTSGRLSSWLKTVAVLPPLLGILSIFLPLESYAERALSIFDLEDVGNDIRVDRWMDAIGIWVDSPLLIGSQTGRYTNVTANFGGESTVVESSLLQQLVNFGLLGAILFYLLMLALFLRVPNQNNWLRAGVFGAVTQTLVYQSIEVLPFIFVLSCLALIPAVSRTTSAAESSGLVNDVRNRKVFQNAG